MNIRYLLIVVLGLIWVLVGIIVSEARQRQCPVKLFYCLGSFFAAVLLALIAGTDVLRQLFSPAYRTAILCLVGGSVLNGTGQALCMSNLKQGGRALAYAIPQQAFLFSYFWSIFFWKQHVSVLSVTGILLILFSVFYLSVCKSGSVSTTLPPRRILQALLSMAVLGASQILVGTSSQLENGAVPHPLAGAFIILLANGIFFLGLCLIERTGLKHLGRTACMAALWSLCALGTYSILLPAIALLARIGRAGIVFPVGIGIMLLFYSMFTSIRYKEKMNARQKLAFLGLVGGIVAAGL